MIQTINETKSWFFEKINKISKPLANMTKQRRDNTQINETKVGSLKRLTRSINP
jgi:hypothetical protein